MVNREDVADMLSQLGAFCDDDGLGDFKFCQLS